MNPVATADSMIDQARSVSGPRRVLSRQREHQLTQRQRELLDALDDVFENGFAHLTMADLAARLNCSLRTLYEIASGRDELVLIVVDRKLRVIGRAAHEAINDSMTPIQAVRAYLQAASVAVSHTTPQFSRDMASMPAGVRLNSNHSNYLVKVTKRLLDCAVDQGEIAPIDTAAVAHTVAGLGRYFANAEVMSDISSTPKEAADALVDIVLAGLTAPTNTKGET